MYEKLVDTVITKQLDQAALMVFQFNRCLCIFLYKVKDWYLKYWHTQYNGYVEVSVILLCISTSESVSWIYECFEISSLFYWVWDNMIHTILSLYYTYFKKMFVMFDIFWCCCFRSWAVFRWSGLPVLPVEHPVSKTSSFPWV